jgi:hypothetical protein
MYVRREEDLHRRLNRHEEVFLIREGRSSMRSFAKTLRNAAAYKEHRHERHV